MSATTKKPPTPKTLQKRKLTVAAAAEQWERGKRLIDEGKPLMDEAAPILDAYFERTKRDDYKGRIGWTWSGGQKYLDQKAIREYLGAKIAAFEKRAKRSRSLVLLK